MRICSVPFCHQKHRKDLTRSFHEFPCKADVREKWIRIVSRLDPDTKELWQPKDNSVVCSKHFVDSDYRPSLKTRQLKPDVVPTIFSDYPSYMQKAAQKLATKRKEPAKRLPLPPQAKKSKPRRASLTSSEVDVVESQSETEILSTNPTLFKDVSVQVSPTVHTVDSCIQVPECTMGRAPQTIQETRRKLKSSRSLNYVMRKRMEQLKMKMSLMQQKIELYEKYPISKVVQSADSGSLHAQFVLEQLQVYHKRTKRLRFSDKSLEVCHTWKQYCSSRSYEYVRRIGLLELPSSQTLTRHQLAIAAAQSAGLKEKEEAAAALINETIESVVKSSCDQLTLNKNVAVQDELNNTDSEMESQAQNKKPIFLNFAPGKVYYMPNSLDENTNNEKTNNDNHPQTTLTPTVLQVLANDHCYYGTVPTTVSSEPVPTRLRESTASCILEQLLTLGVTSCGDFG